MKYYLFQITSLHFPCIGIFLRLVRVTYTYFQLHECVVYLELFQNYYQLNKWN